MTFRNNNSDREDKDIVIAIKQQSIDGYQAFLILIWHEKIAEKISEVLLT